MTEVFKRGNLKDNTIVRGSNTRLPKDHRIWQPNLNERRISGKDEPYSKFRQVDFTSSQTVGLNSIFNQPEGHTSELLLTLRVRDPNNGLLFNKVVNFGHADKLTLDQYHQMFDQILAKGKFNTPDEQKRIFEQMIIVLKEYPNIIDVVGMESFIELVNKLQIPTNYIDLGVGRFLNQKVIKANRDKLILYFIKIDAPLELFKALDSIYPNYLDLETLAPIPRRKAEQLINQGLNNVIPQQQQDGLFPPQQQQDVLFPPAQQQDVLFPPAQQENDKGPADESYVENMNNRIKFYLSELNFLEDTPEYKVKAQRLENRINRYIDEGYDENSKFIIDKKIKTLQKLVNKYVTPYMEEEEAGSTYGQGFRNMTRGRGKGFSPGYSTSFTVDRSGRGLEELKQAFIKKYGRK